MDDLHSILAMLLVYEVWVISFPHSIFVQLYHILDLHSRLRVVLTRLAWVPHKIPCYHNKCPMLHRTDHFHNRLAASFWVKYCLWYRRSTSQTMDRTSCRRSTWSDFLPWGPRCRYSIIRTWDCTAHLGYKSATRSDGDIQRPAYVFLSTIKIKRYYQLISSSALLLAQEAMRLGITLPSY